MFTRQPSTGRLFCLASSGQPSPREAPVPAVVAARVAGLLTILVTGAASASGPATPLGPESLPGRALVKLRADVGATAASDLTGLLANDGRVVAALAATAEAAGAAGAAGATGSPAVAPRLVRAELLFPRYAGAGASRLAELLATSSSSPALVKSRVRASRQLELGRWVVVEADEPVAAHVLVEALRQHPDVEVAEPDWLARYTFDPNDYVPATHGELDFIDAPQAWDLTQGAASQVIAILDTGVDWDHQDLAAKIWANNEPPGDGNGDTCPGICAVDDDGDGLIDEDGNGIQKGQGGWNAAFAQDDDENGFIDDLRGWDFVNNDNNPNDDNGHGTHCAAIAAAATNNGLGRPGVCPNCVVMPVKTLSASGVGSFSNIAKSIDYAASNGATVISMSFTSVSASSLMSTALDAAFPDAVLVSAAGNDGKNRAVTPYYPAHYDNVVGVEASDNTGALAGFSNFGYAVRAPGVDIQSAVPDDLYATWSGTSMAAPVVAGIAGLVRSANPGWPPALVYGHLIQTDGAGAASQALLIPPEPKLELISFSIFDTAGSCPLCDGDGKPDAGETVDVEVRIRNFWADALGVAVSVSTSAPDLTIIDGNSALGTVGGSQFATNSGDRFRVAISPTVNHGALLELLVNATGTNVGAPLVGLIELAIQRGVNRSGQITTNETWTSGNLYVVDGNLQVNSGVTLTIQPGTTVAFHPGIQFRSLGHVIARGTPTNRITFTATSGCMSKTIQIGSAPPATYDMAGNYLTGTALQYVEILPHAAGASSCETAISNYGAAYVADNVVRTSCTSCKMSFTGDSHFERNAIYDFVGSTEAMLFIINGMQARNNSLVSVLHGSYGVVGTFSGNNVVGATTALTSWAGPPLNYDASGNYWGTTEANAIEALIFDFVDDLGYPRILWPPALTAPNPLAPPIVSSITLDPVSPVGEDLVTFTVSFSRAMDPAYPPRVTFGNTPPYDQHAVTEGGIWVDANTWQVQKQITVFIGGEGPETHRIVVRDARDADDGVRIADKDYRFSFVIDTSDSSTRSLSASGRVGGVDLTWTPADGTVEDIAGNNVYRSTNPTTGFAKINGPLVTNCTPTECTYSDLSVIAGITYYYYVRPVTTALLEGPASETDDGTPTDTVFPTINHSAIAQAPAGQLLTIVATMTDNVTIANAQLLHRPLGSAVAYTPIAMVNATGNQFTANIPANAMTQPGVEYYLEAEDDAGNLTFHGTETTPHPVLVVDVPVVSTVDPATGPASGGTLVTITGLNFKDTPSVPIVRFGGTPSPLVTFVSATELQAVTPARYPLLVDVEVENTGNAAKGKRTSAFTFLGTTMTLTLPAASGDQATTVQVPINVASAEGLLSADITVSFNPAVLTPQTALVGSLTTGFGIATNTAVPGQVTVGIVRATPVTSTSAGSIAILRFTVTGSAGTSTALQLTTATLNGGAIPVAFNNGSVTVNNSFLISGTTTFWQASRPVPQVSLQLTGSAVQSTASNPSGSYQFAALPNGSYTVTPAKSDAVTPNEVSTLDASLILQHAIGAITLTGNTAVAADVNKSGAIDTLDAASVLEYVAGLHGLPFNGSPQVWDFTPSLRSYPTLTSNQSAQSYTAILVGDATGNWGAAPDFMNVSGSPPAATLAAPYLTAQPGTSISVPLVLTGGTGTLGLDLRLAYDPAVLQPTAVTLSGLAAGFSLESNATVPGQINLAMAGANSVAADGVVAEVTFTVIGALSTQSALDLVGGRINEGELSVELVDGLVRVLAPAVFADGFEDGTTGNWDED